MASNQPTYPQATENLLRETAHLPTHAAIVRVLQHYNDPATAGRWRMPVEDAPPATTAANLLAPWLFNVVSEWWRASKDTPRAGAYQPHAVRAILALIAWDDSADMLDMPVDAVRLLAASGHPPAVLMLPACIALTGDRHE